MMRGTEKEESRDLATDKLWSVFINLLYLLLVISILLLGYFTLNKEIHNYLNRKIYTPQELADIQEEAKARRRSRIADENWDKVVNGIHLRTGLHNDTNLQIIIGSCTSCHSSKLITQNKATREGWKSMITWMQETQGLGDLGTNEPIILNYLSKYYAPVETGRRKTLDVAEIEWYDLESNE
jgi:hypothetical protein